MIRDTSKFEYKVRDASGKCVICEAGSGVKHNEGCIVIEHFALKYRKDNYEEEIKRLRDEVDIKTKLCHDLNSTVKVMWRLIEWMVDRG